MLTPVWLLLALTFWVAACDATTSADLAGPAPRLVIGGLFEADSLWKIDVTRTQDVTSDSRGLQPHLVKVDGATVVIRQGETVIDTLEQYVFKGRPTRVYFSPDDRPEPGVTYSLHASAPGFDPAEARGRAPRSVSFEASVDTVRVSGSHVTLDVAVSFDDPAGEANYYEIALVEHLRYVHDRDSMRADYHFFSTSDPLLLEGSYDRVVADAGAPTYSRAAQFNDRAIDGTRHTIQMKTRVSSEMLEEERFQGLYVVLKTLSAKYYRYKKSRQPLEDAVDLANPFQEPVQLYSNVEGGLGIFAGSNARAVRLKLGQP